MNGFLLDTNTVSEATKPSPSPEVVEWFGSVPEESLYLSVLTIGELRHGIHRLTVGPKRLQLEAWIQHKLLDRFDRRVLPVTLAVAVRWGELYATTQAAGRPVPVLDGLLAATALVHDLTVVTRNVSDFVAAGVPTLNPWHGSAKR